MSKTSSASKVLEKLKQGIQSTRAPPHRPATMPPTEEPLDYACSHLTPAMQEEARVDLHETEETRARALQEIRQLIQKERKLVTPVDDAFLLRFLRSRKFNVKKSFKLLQNFWMFRKENSSVYDSTDPEPVKQLLFRNVVGFLKKRDRRGCVVMILKFGQWEPSLDPLEMMFRCMTALLLHSIVFPATQVAGYRVIVDCRGLSWPQYRMCTIPNLLLLVHSTQFCFPARYKAFHILSENKLFSFVWTILYPLLTSKLKKRVMLHGGDVSPLKEYIHPSVLPDEFGGVAGPFDNSSWGDVIDGDCDSIMELLNYGYMD